MERLGEAELRELDVRLGARLEREELALERLEEAELRVLDVRLGARLELDELGWDLERLGEAELRVLDARLGVEPGRRVVLLGVAVLRVLAERPEGGGGLTLRLEAERPRLELLLCELSELG